MNKPVMIAAISAAAVLMGACTATTTPTTSSAGSSTGAYSAFDTRSECMQASWTSFSECDSRFPSSSGYSPSGTYGSSSGSSSYGSSSDLDDLGDDSCRMLSNLGSTGDYETDQMSRAFRNNYCTSTGMRSNPDHCGALRDMPLSGDPETDRLRSSVLNNYC